VRWSGWFSEAYRTGRKPRIEGKEGFSGGGARKEKARVRVCRREAAGEFKGERRELVVGVLGDVCREGFTLAASSCEEDDTKRSASPRSIKVGLRVGFSLGKKKAKRRRN
jgi:hypothetical protein